MTTKQYDPEQFAAAWNSEEFARNFNNLPAGYDHLNCPLTKLPRSLVLTADIPENAKDFLYTSGLPSSFLGFRFHTLENGVPPIPDIRPQAINNGVELPPIRYTMYSKIGENEYGDTDVCVMKYRGHIFWLDYGSPVYWQSGRELIGPRFVASSVPQLAYLLLTVRDMYIEEGLIHRQAYTHPGRLANKMRTAMAKIDPAAVYGWDSGWGFMLQTIKDQMF